ncbi:MAG: hypothetical protein [Olavius algarvensis Delta 4 endosymbiont]|nr:MAG: hypothetical protein [Olavius algarvensis Delta 4 endosymbiont]
MKTPNPHQFRDFFDTLPAWVLPLILVLLFGRFVIAFFFYIFS